MIHLEPVTPKTGGAYCGYNSGKPQTFSRYEHTKSPHERYGTRAACHGTPNLIAAAFE